MKNFFADTHQSLSVIDRPLLCFCVVWTSLLISLNYGLGIENELIRRLDSRLEQFLALFLMYSSAFAIPYLFVVAFRSALIVTTPGFWTLLLFAPALFALKVSIVNPLQGRLDGIWGDYLTIITTLPFKLLVVLIPLAIIYRIFPRQGSFWGMTSRNIRWWPYILILILMMPLIIFAGTQKDFLAIYPRVQQIDFIASHVDRLLWYQLWFEISYGIDFITIELFFRGFLVLAFARYAGSAAILPMAVFYCSIHFGKPLLECISSFFGGLVLGVIVNQTRSIIGGLVVHLGIAWMMELSGYLGNRW